MKGYIREHLKSGMIIHLFRQPRMTVCLFRAIFLHRDLSMDTSLSLLNNGWEWKLQPYKSHGAALIIDTSAITLPKVMKQAGYVTGSVGKWHIGLGLLLYCSPKIHKAHGHSWLPE